MNPTTKQDRSSRPKSKPDPTFHKNGTAERCRLPEFRLYAVERAVGGTPPGERAEDTFERPNHQGLEEAVWRQMDRVEATSRLFNVKRGWLTGSITHSRIYESTTTWSRTVVGYKTLADDDPTRPVLEEYEAACRRVLPFREMVRITREVPKSTTAIEELYASLDEGAQAELRGVVNAYLMAAELAISARAMLASAKAEAEAVLARRCDAEPLVRNTEVV